MAADTGDGTAWIARLRKAVGSGEPIDLAPGIADDESDPPDAGQALSARELPAEDIRALLLEPVLRVDPQGLQIRGALVTGRLDLDYAKLPCRLVFTRCRFENAPSFNQATMPGLVLKTVRVPGLSLHSAQLTGDCDLAELRSTGEVIAENIDIDGDLGLTGARLSNPAEMALTLNGAEIAGGVFLDGLEATGEVRAARAHIGGALVLVGAKLSNPTGDALTLDSTDITGSAFLNGLETAGKVRAPDTHIRAQLVMTEAKLSNPGRDALTLYRAHIAGGAFLDGLEATGEVRAAGAHVGGALVLTGAKLSNPGGKALRLDSAEITGTASLDGLEASGEVLAADAHMGGQLVLTGAKLSNPGGNALRLDSADITGTAFLDRLEATGEVLTVGAHMRRGLVLTGAKLSNPDGNALNLSAATLDTLILDDAFTAEGRTNLSFASIRILSVGTEKPEYGLPPLSGAHGWALGTVHGFLRTDRRSARAWLDTIPTQPDIGSRKEFFSQPWKEMAKIYDQIGQPEDARRLRFWAARRTTKVAPWTSKVVRVPYALLVGYGYYPLIVLGWLASLWLIALVLCTLNAPDFTPTEARVSTITITTNNRSEEVRVTGATPPPSSYPQFDPLLFAMDTALPAAATGQTNAWRITGDTWLPGIFAVIKGFAWLLTALLLAGITGILRKD